MNKATFDYPYGLEKIEQYFITQLLRYETVFGDGSEGETSHNLTYSSNERVSKASIHLVCLSFTQNAWYGGGNSTSAEEVLQIPASLP